MQSREERLAAKRAWYHANKDRAQATTRAWREKNLEKVLAAGRRRRAESVEYYREASRQWRRKNAERVKAYNKKWQTKNRVYVKAKRQEAYAKNPELFRRRKRNWTKNNPEKVRRIANRRYAMNEQFRLGLLIREQLRKFLKGAYKESTVVRTVGCTRTELRDHIQRQFTEGMTWENYGEWELDHVKELVAFDLTDPLQHQQARHYTNIQPLWSEDNKKKSAAARCQRVTSDPNSLKAFQAALN